MRLSALCFAVLLSSCAVGDTYPIQLPDANSPFDAAAVLPYQGHGFRCSSFAIAPHVAATAKHCTEKIGKGVIVQIDGSSVPVSAFWQSSSADAALLYVDSELPDVLRSGPLLPTLGDRTVVAGYGCDTADGVWSLGIRTAYVRHYGGDSLLFNGAVCPGDSGGLVTNGQGELVGIIVSSDTKVGKSAIFWATPFEYVIPGMRDLSWATEKTQPEH